MIFTGYDFYTVQDFTIPETDLNKYWIIEPASQYQSKLKTIFDRHGLAPIKVGSKLALS